MVVVACSTSPDFLPVTASSRGLRHGGNLIYADGKEPAAATESPERRAPVPVYYLYYNIHCAQWKLWSAAADDDTGYFPPLIIIR